MNDNALAFTDHNREACLSAPIAAFSWSSSISFGGLDFLMFICMLWFQLVLQTAKHKLKITLLPSFAEEYCYHQHLFPLVGLNATLFTSSLFS